MRIYLQIVVWVIFLITIPGQLFAQNKVDQVIAQDKNIQFILKRSDTFSLIMQDAKTGYIILEIPDLDCKPDRFYENQGRYYFLCLGNKNQFTVWEIEEEFGRVLLLDLNSEDLKKYRLLTN